jgi:hypothetical protein
MPSFIFPSTVSFAVKKESVPISKLGTIKINAKAKNNFGFKFRKKLQPHHQKASSLFNTGGQVHCPQMLINT